MIRRIRRIRWKNYQKLKSSHNLFLKPNNWLKLKKYENKKRRLYLKRKFLLKNTPNIDSKIKIKNNILIIPDKIDFEDNISNLYLLIDRIKSYKKIIKFETRIDLSEMKDISINALIFLISELDKIGNMRRRERFKMEKVYKYTARYGIDDKNEKLKFLLLKIGYWDYFGIHNPYTLSKDTKDQYFLSIQTGNLSETKQVAILKEFIQEKVGFLKNDIIEEYFDDAITEAMFNSVEHGYIDKIPNTKKGKWWFCGHYDKNENYIEFTFKDYGVGLRRTLEYNGGKRLDKILIMFKKSLMTDSEIIKLLVNDKIPKYKDKKDKVRGYGFKKFKQFAKNIGYNCKMKIISGKGKYVYDINATTQIESEQLEDLDYEIGGVLLNWKIYL